MRHNPFDSLGASFKFPRYMGKGKTYMGCRPALFLSNNYRCLRLLTMLMLYSVSAFVYASDDADTTDDKCSPSKWLKIDAEYMQALRASDIGRLRGLRSKKEALLLECNRSGFSGAGSTGSGGETGGPGAAPGIDPGGSTGPGSAPPMVTSPGRPPGTAPGGPGAVSPSGAGPGSSEGASATVTGSGMPPVTQAGGGAEGSGGAATEPKDSGDTLTAEERKRKEEWDKRQEFTERMVREQAALTEANSSPVVTVWNDFWGSVFNGGKPTPVEPLREPSFADLLSDGDPLATRLQQIRDQVGNGVPSQQQLDEIRDLSRAAQQGQAESAVAIVKTNVTAADLAQAGEVVSQIGASAGQAAAEYVLVNSGVPQPIANAATTALYDGLQHYDKGVTAVIIHGTVSAATGALGNAAGNKVGGLLGEAAETVGGRILQGAAGGAVSGATGKFGHTVADGKEVKVGEIIQDAVIGGVVGGVIKPIAGAIDDINTPSSSPSGGSIAGTVDDINVSTSSGQSGGSIADTIDDVNVPTSSGQSGAGIADTIDDVNVSTGSGQSAATVADVVEEVKAPPVKLHWPGGNPPLKESDIGNVIGAGVKPVVGYASSTPETGAESVKPEQNSSSNIKLPDTLPAE